jgi:hypothetical protein
MITKFGRHSLNVLEALGTKVKTLGIMVFLDPSQFHACHKKSKNTLGSHDYSCIIENARSLPPSSPFFSLTTTF